MFIITISYGKLDQSLGTLPDKGAFKALCDSRMCCHDHIIAD